MFYGLGLKDSSFLLYLILQMSVQDIHSLRVEKMEKWDMGIIIQLQTKVVLQELLFSFSDVRILPPNEESLKDWSDHGPADHGALKATPSISQPDTNRQ